MSAARIHGAGGSGGFGGDRYRGGTHLKGMTGTADGCYGGLPGGNGLPVGWGRSNGPASSPVIAAAKSLDGPCVPGGPYPRGYAWLGTTFA